MKRTMWLVAVVGALAGCQGSLPTAPMAPVPTAPGPALPAPSPGGSGAQSQQIRPALDSQLSQARKKQGTSSSRTAPSSASGNSAAIKPAGFSSDENDTKQPQDEVAGELVPVRLPGQKPSAQVVPLPPVDSAPQELSLRWPSPVPEYPDTSQRRE